MHALLLLLSACDSHTEPEAPHTEHAEHTEHTEPEAPHTEHSTPPALTLSLNDGTRWQMDPHTRETMGLTRTTLSEAVVADAASGQSLGVTLQGQLDQLISGCTMTGADHDALHGFLTVYIPAVQALQAVTDDASATAQLTALRAMVAEYDRFFE